MGSPPIAMFFLAGYRGKPALSSSLGQLGHVPAGTLALPGGQLALRDQGAGFAGREAEQEPPPVSLYAPLAVGLYAGLCSICALTSL